MTLALLLTATGIVPRRHYAGRAMRAMERSLLIAKNGWYVFAAGFFEPLFYLLSLGVGLGRLVPGIAVGEGRVVSYLVFMAPAMLAASAMNAAVYEACINLFFKLKWQSTFTSMLATPVGVADVALAEVGWSTLRGSLYTTLFVALMGAGGLLPGPWGLLALPAALLLGFCFSCLGVLAASYMRSINHMEVAFLFSMVLFLFSGTFAPLSAYPTWLQWLIVAVSPLYHGVQLTRGATLGTLGWAHLGHAAYLLVVALLSLAVASRSLARQLRV